MGERTIHIRPRYYRRLTDPGVEMLEVNCRYAFLDWKLPFGEAVLVCIDVWDSDIHADMRAEDDHVTVERIVPVVAACRRAGLPIVHAPAWPTAKTHPNWLQLVGDETPQKPYPSSPDWPPQEFRTRTGRYACYAKPREPRAAECDMVNKAPGFHPLVQPIGDEPVIANGEELHRLCAKKGWLHLIFVGFHTPGCVTNRDYGPPKMIPRGYHCILLRDCTNGMESHENHAEKIGMRGTIPFLEMTGMYSLTSQEWIAALEGAGR